jgi:thioredoxin reductase
MHDVIIIGGSYAGLAAALQLGRARRRVLILDAGQRRNRFAHAAHGFLCQDGQPPDAIAARARAEVLAYPTVEWREAVVTEVGPVDGGFSVRTGGEHHHARRVILATGVVDELPTIPGLAERWGSTVFHCPYCHGYELDRGRLGVLATSPLSVHHAVLVSEWAAPGQMTLFTNGWFEPDADQLADMAARGIAVEREPVTDLSGAPPRIAVRLHDGRAMDLDGLFLVPRTVLRDRFAEQLGCELDVSPFGPFYRTDRTMETTVAGIFACGDAATATPVIAAAVADGTRAGAAAHQSLVFRR